MILLQIPDLETIVHAFDIIHVLLVSYIKMFYGSCFPYLVLSYVPRLHASLHLANSRRSPLVLFSVCRKTTRLAGSYLILYLE